MAKEDIKAAREQASTDAVGTLYCGELREVGTKELEDGELYERAITHASDYVPLQSRLIGLVKIAKPKSILELGLGGKQFAVALVQALTNGDIESQVTIVNSNTEFLNEAKKATVSLANIKIIETKMWEFVKKSLENFDLIYLLYNFHHIIDSDLVKREKTAFILNCYKNMKAGSYLCIADVFLPESCDESQLKSDKILNALYKQRATEAAALTYWNNLSGVDPRNHRAAIKDAQESEAQELDVFERVRDKDHEFLVKKSWLLNEVEDARFQVVINHDVNGIGDAILLLKKI
jgi:SAM-dependent methyltransferase